MKAKILTLAAALLIVISGDLRSQHAVTNNIANFNITENGTKFSFDIFTLKTSNAEFRMGNSSYFIRYVTGTFSNPVLTYVNPRFTSGSVSASYDQMRPFGYSSGRVAVQLYYNTNGPGDDVSSVPGPDGYGEKIATVKMDIISLNLPDVRWDNLNTAVVNVQNQTATSNNLGSFNGTLPVELSAFSAAANGNSIRLDWSTNMEENNSGFEVQRKAASGEWIRAGFVNGRGNSSSPVNYTFSDRNLPKGSYNYRIKQIDFNGNFEIFELDSPVDIGIPEKFTLHQNYPNPFNPSTVISFELPYDSKVSLRIFDMSGREVSTLINNEFRSADYYSVTMNGASLSSGVYFYELRTSKEMQTGKMTLVK
jgi:hypothetical protein